MYLYGVWQLIKSEESTCSTSLLNYITRDVCELPYTAVKLCEAKNRMGDLWKCLGYLGKLMTHAASNEHAHLNPEKYCQCTCSPQQCRLVWAWWMAAFHWQSIMSCQYMLGEENMLMLRVLYVMELFSDGTVFCLLRNAVVGHNEFTISWTSGNLLPMVPISFLPVVLYPHLHLDPLMWCRGFWEHIDWPIWEKGRISNRFLKTGG